MSNFDIKKAKQNHNYIEEKMILDSINSIQIVSDHNNVLKTRNTFFLRTLDALSGNSRKRQEFINENLLNSLSGAINHLQNHDKHLSKIDDKIADLANELIKTQDEILKFFYDYQTLKNQVLQINEIMNERFKDFEKRIKHLEAKDFIRTEISYLKSGEKYQNYSIPLKIYSLVDNLFNGEFGLVYSKKQDDEMMRFLRSELINYINEQNLTKEDELNFMQITKNIDNNSKKALEFISASHYNNLIIYNQPKSTNNLINILTSKEINSKDELNFILNQPENTDINRFLTYEDFTKKCISEIKNSIN